MIGNMRERSKAGNKVRCVIPCIVLLAPFVNYWFYSICIVLGLECGEVENASFFSVAAIVLLIFCFTSQIKSVTIDGLRCGRSVWIFLCLVALIAIDLFLNNNDQQYNYFLNFILFGGLGILAGTYLSTGNMFNKAWISVDIIAFVCTAGSVIFEIAQYSDLGFVSRGYAGLSYQAISYMSAIAYSFTLWSIACVEPSSSLSLLNKRVFRNIKILLLPIQVIVAAISGGRGGIVAIAAVTIVVIAIRIKWGHIRVRRGLCIIAVAAALLAFLAFWGDFLFSYAGFERLLTRGDNRSDIWGIAIRAIGESPYFGYGFGGYGSTLGVFYPHNFFLDIALSAGMLGLVLFLAALIYLLNKLFIVMKGSHEWGSFLALTGVFSFAYLSVSGTFISFAPFWFVVAALIAYEGTGDSEKLTVSRGCRES